MMDKKDGIMPHIHKKFTVEQVKDFLKAYIAGHIRRTNIETTLGIGIYSFLCLAKRISRRLWCILENMPAEKQPPIER